MQVHASFLYKIIHSFHSFISGMHHYECIAPNIDINLQSGRFSATFHNMADNKYDTDYASWTHNRPIKLHNFSHIQASFLCRIQLRSIHCKQLVQEKLAQESMPYAQQTCTSSFHKILRHVSPLLMCTIRTIDSQSVDVCTVWQQKWQTVLWHADCTIYKLTDTRCSIKCVALNRKIYIWYRKNSPTTATTTTSHFFLLQA